MHLVLEAALFCIGLALQLFLNAVLWAPLLYGMPRASYWVLRGWSHYTAPLRYLRVAFQSLVMASLAFLALALFWHGAYDYLRNDGAFGLGAAFGIAIGVLPLLRRSGREMLSRDFAAFMRNSLTPAGAAVATRPPRASGPLPPPPHRRATE